MSADPILGSYLPTGNKKRDANLPGMGGVFNPVNLALYHYAGNNPIKYIDPKGKAICIIAVIAAISAYCIALTTSQDFQFDMYEISEDLSSGDWGWLIVDVIGLAIPAVSVVLLKKGAKGLGRLGKWLAKHGDDLIKRIFKSNIVDVSIDFQGVVAKRIKLGKAKGKLAVIGRGMKDRVEKFAKGIGAETFKPSEDALDLWKKGDDSLLMKENKSWVDKINKEGYTVLDVGLDPNYTKKGNFDKGPYYQMETKEVFGDK